MSLLPHFATRFRRYILCLVILGTFSFAGCNAENVLNPNYVRDDNYERMPEPDYTLRQLMGVRTLRTSFEMPEEMRSFRVGLILVAKRKVIGSQGWHSGNGLHRTQAGVTANVVTR